ncbi:MAG: hypothetical protein ABEJ67_03280 [Halanaeroarchaeum sp.]
MSAAPDVRNSLDVDEVTAALLTVATAIKSANGTEYQQAADDVMYDFQQWREVLDDD